LHGTALLKGNKCPMPGAGTGRFRGFRRSKLVKVLPEIVIIHDPPSFLI
jgi:hypothetical protein